MTPRDLFRTVVNAFKTEFSSEEKQRNPWPLCQFCYHRRPPYELCAHADHPVDCCVGCCMYGGAHPDSDREKEENL